MQYCKDKINRAQGIQPEPKCRFIEFRSAKAVCLRAPISSVQVILNGKNYKYFQILKDECLEIQKEFFSIVILRAEVGSHAIIICHNSILFFAEQCTVIQPE